MYLIPDFSVPKEAPKPPRSHKKRAAGALPRADKTKFDRPIGRELSDEEVKAHMGLIYLVSRRYSGYGIEDEDLRAEAQIGLIYGLRTYDSSKGKLSSWLAINMRHACLNSLRKGALSVRLPMKHIKAARDWYKWESKATSKQDDADIESIASANNLSVNEVTKACKSAALLASTRSKVSLSSAFNDVSMDRILALTAVDCHNDDKCDNRTVRELLAKLPPRTADVLFRYFGFSGEEETLADISHDHGITRERARQLKEEGIKKLKFLLRKDTAA